MEQDFFFYYGSSGGCAHSHRRYSTADFSVLSLLFVPLSGSTTSNARERLVVAPADCVAARVRSVNPRSPSGRADDCCCSTRKRHLLRPRGGRDACSSYCAAHPTRLAEPTFLFPTASRGAISRPSATPDTFHFGARPQPRLHTTEPTEERQNCTVAALRRPLRASYPQINQSRTL